MPPGQVFYLTSVRLIAHNKVRERAGEGRGETGRRGEGGEGERGRQGEVKKNCKLKIEN